jgi:hypothetical protein
VFCVLNRRHVLREQQYGRVTLVTYDGTQLEVDLFDISTRGVGFEVATRDLSKISSGQKVQIKCNWNPLLLDKGGYEIRSIQGRRVGAERVRKF